MDMQAMVRVENYSNFFLSFSKLRTPWRQPLAILGIGDAAIQQRRNQKYAKGTLNARLKADCKINGELNV